MAQIDTIKFGDVIVMLGDGATPTELFEAPCGVTSINWTTSTNTNDEDLPDCENNDAVGYQSPTVVSIGDQVQLQGFVDGDSHKAWIEFIQSGEPKNVRIVYDKGTNAGGGRKGHYQFPAIVTNREEAFERRQSGRINVTLVAKSMPVWTPLT